MNLREWSNDCYRDLPRIDRAEARLWCGDFWDGPLAGVLTYHGERLWYQMCEEYQPPDDNQGEWPWYRRFLVVRLTPDQLPDEEYWHDLFCRYVGTHLDWDESQTDRGARPAELHDRFYEPYKSRVPPDLSDNEVIGWFES